MNLCASDNGGCGSAGCVYDGPGLMHCATTQQPVASSGGGGSSGILFGAAGAGAAIFVLVIVVVIIKRRRRMPTNPVLRGNDESSSSLAAVLRHRMNSTQKSMENYFTAIAFVNPFAMPSDKGVMQNPVYNDDDDNNNGGMYDEAVRHHEGLYSRPSDQHAHDIDLPESGYNIVGGINEDAQVGYLDINIEEKSTSRQAFDFNGNKTTQGAAVKVTEMAGMLQEQADDLHFLKQFEPAKNNKMAASYQTTAQAATATGMAANKKTTNQKAKPVDELQDLLDNDVGYLEQFEPAQNRNHAVIENHPKTHEPSVTTDSGQSTTRVPGPLLTSVLSPKPEDIDYLFAMEHVPANTVTPASLVAEALEYKPTPLDTNQSNSLNEVGKQ